MTTNTEEKNIKQKKCPKCGNVLSHGICENCIVNERDYILERITDLEKCSLCGTPSNTSDVVESVNWFDEFTRELKFLHMESKIYLAQSTVRICQDCIVKEIESFKKEKIISSLIPFIIGIVLGIIIGIMEESFIVGLIVFGGILLLFGIFPLLFYYLYVKIKYSGDREYSIKQCIKNATSELESKYNDSLRFFKEENNRFL